jgi:hypothetical protein
MTTQDIAELARATGRAGQSWNHFQCMDDVQAYVDEHNAGDVDTWHAAFDQGVVEHCIESGWINVWTTAPEGYDYGQDTIVMESCGAYRGGELRRVLCNPRGMAGQTARYRSGLYLAATVDPRIAEREAEQAAAARAAEYAAYAARRAAGQEWLQSATDGEITALKESDTEGPEQRGLTHADLRQALRDRAEARAAAELATEWDKARAAFQDGAIIVDVGSPPVRGTWGTVAGRDPHVYYGCKVLCFSSRNDPEKAEVRDEHGGCPGPLSFVAEAIARGVMRIVAATDVPPAKVTQRIGHDRWDKIQRYEIGGRVVWVGYPRFANEPLVLDEHGNKVRARAIVDEALRSYQRR